MADSGRAKLVGLALLLLAAALTLYPPLWMLAASLKTSGEILGHAGFGRAGFDNYATAFARRPFGRYLVNSLLAAGASVAITIGLGALAAYGFAKFRFRLQGAFWLIVLASFMVPLEAVIIPLFLEVYRLGWSNTYAGLLLPTALNAVGIFILRQAMLGIPDDYVEAARIDGANELRILFSVVLPLVAPSLAVVGILTFNMSWNSYLWPLVVVSDDSLRTLPLGMALFQSSFNTQYGQVMAVSVFGTLPTLVLFMLFQRQLLEGSATTGLK